MDDWDTSPELSVAYNQWLHLALNNLTEATFETSREYRNARLAYKSRVSPGSNHKSDCSVYNAPAFPPGPCDCGKDK